MKEENRLWQLLSRKLANECSEQELQELNELIQQHPHLQHSIDFIADWWQKCQEETTKDTEAEKVFQKIMQRNKQEQRLPALLHLPYETKWNFMFRNYFKAAWRSFSRDRQFSVLNIAGLSAALTCGLLIYLWIAAELSIDKFHANKDRLYQVMAHIELPDGIQTQENTPFLLARALAKEMPEVKAAVSLQQGYGQGVISAGEKHIKTSRYFADEQFFNLFSYPLLEGNKNTVLKDKFSVLLSDKMATKLFGTTKNIIGKSLQWENGKQPFTVSGIFEDPTSNSSITFDVLFTYEYYYQGDTANNKNWANSSPFTFLLLKKDANAKQLENKLTSFLHSKYDKSPLKLSLRKYSDRYLYNTYENGVQSGGRIRYVWLFSIISFFILLIACINFMNLSTAKAAKRMKEAGIRKNLGAGRSSLVFQYMLESMFIAFASLFIALLVVSLLLPQFSAITGQQLSLSFNPFFILVLISIGLLTGLLAGIYPAFHLSAFKPAMAIKGKMRTALGELWMRKGLVVFQYTVSIIFIVAVIVIYKQINLIRTIDLGYNKDNIISFKNERAGKNHFNAFMNDIKKIPGVSAAASFDADLYGSSSGSTEHADWDGNTSKNKILFTALDVDYGLMELLDMKIKEGRSFSKDYASDSLAIILNESAIHAMGMKSPVGKTFSVWGTDFRITGVVKDFHFEPLYEKIKPCFMRLNPAGSNILVKIAAGTERQTISGITDVYKQYNPGFLFDFNFLDKDYEAIYHTEERQSVLLAWFTGLAIIISCLGVFGLAAYTAEQRTKEIGIRKVLGASTGGIAAMLSKYFLQLVIISIFVATPLAWWAMNQWLQSFAYRVEIRWWMFALAGFAAIMIALITVSFQAIKAAIANPVKSLRTE